MRPSAVPRVGLSEAVAGADDRELTLAFQRGEGGAYELIFEKYSPRVERVCRRILSQPQEAEEAAQETFLRVYQGLVRFNGRYQLGAWVTRIATNVCLDTLRARSRRPSDSTDPELLDRDVERSVDGPEEMFIRNAESRRVRRILETLPPLHRAAIVLREFEGFSYQEIAGTLHMSEAQVKALLHRARKSFRRNWTAPIGIILVGPRAAWHRLRRLDDRTRNPVAAQNASSTTAMDAVNQAAGVMAQCSHFVQQCGQLLSEKAAAVGVATAVGVAAGAVGVAAYTKTQPVVLKQARSSIEKAEPVDRAARSAPSRTQVALTHDSDRDAPIAPDHVPEEQAPPEVVPSPEPPVAEPSPEPEPEGARPPAPSPSPSPSPSQSATPAPVQVALGFNHGDPIPWTTPSEHAAKVDCSTSTVQQQYKALISDGDAAYSAQVDIDVDGTTPPQLYVIVWKNGYEVRYNGGAPKAETAISGGQMVIRFEGSYSWTGGVPPNSVGLPDYGRFHAKLTLDCATTSVITESLTFSVN